MLRAVLTMVTVYWWSSVPRREALTRSWARRMLQLSGIELCVHEHGETLHAGAMVVANHVSWIDIFVIDAWRPTPFVAKAEIAKWPVVGWLAKSTGTVFIERSRRADAKRMVERLSSVLENDGLICLFPEGTTTDGLEVARFHANILQAAVSARAPVQPVCLMYADADGRQSLAPAYVGEMTLFQSLRAILAAAPLTAHLYVSAPLRDLAERRGAAEQAHAAVADALRALQGGGTGSGGMPRAGDGDCG